MDLGYYLYKNKISQTAFCKIIDNSRSYLNLIIHKKKRPSEKMARVIEKATHGKVTVKELTSLKEIKD